MREPEGGATGGKAEPGPKGKDPKRKGREVQLTALMARVRRHLLGRFVAAVALWAGASVAALLLLALLLAGASGWPQGTVVPLLLHGAVLAGAAGIVVAGVLWVRRTLSERRLARLVEEGADLPRGAVLGALELSRSVPPGMSADLATTGLRRVAEGVASHPTRQLAGEEHRRLSRAIRSGAVAVAAALPWAVIAGVLAPERAALAWSGIVQPYGLMAEPAYPPLAVSPGDREVLRGEDVEVSVEAVGRDVVTFHHRPDGEVVTEEALPVRGGRASVTIPAVDAPLEYWVQAPDGDASPRYRITPLDPLLLSDLRVEVRFPPHTGQPPEEYRGSPPPLSVPAGSELRVEGRANRPLASASLVWQGEGESEAVGEDDAGEGGGAGDTAAERDAAGEDVAGEADAAGAVRSPGPQLEVDGSGFRGSWVPERSGVWSWELDAEEALPVTAAAETLSDLQLTVIPDEPPTVRLLHPEREADLPLSFRQRVEIEATDDYGVDRVELVAWTVRRRSGEAGEPRTHAMPAGEAREIRLRPVLDASGWELRPGDEIRYYARAVDNAPSPAEARSEEHVLRVPRAAELRRASERALTDAAGRVEELSQRAAEAAQETRALERQSRSGSDRGRERGAGRQEDVDFRQAEEVRSALDRQEQLTDEVEALEAELGELAEGLREAGIMDQELEADLQELRELLDELASADARQQLEEWREAVDEGDRRRAMEALQDLEGSQEEFRDRLEEALERFRRAAAEEDFRALSEEARELAADEQELAERFREGEDLEEDARAQDDLRDRTDELAKGMEALEERLAQLGEVEAGERAAQAREEAEAAREGMEEAAQAARSGEGEEAGDRAEEAASGVESALEELMESQEEMSQQWDEALLEALERTAQDALSMARLQSEVGAALSGASRSGRQSLRRTETALMEGTRNLARNAAIATSMAPALGRELDAAIGRALDAMGETATALGRLGLPTSSATGRVAAGRATEALNQVALIALAQASALQDGADSEGMGDLMSALQELAGDQEELADQSGEMMEMDPGAEGFEDAMQELALGQEQVAEALHELAERPGGEVDPLGDLEAMGEEAREIAEELLQQRLEPEIRERQEDLFHRLLDAGRGIQREGETDQREGTTAEAVERPLVDPLRPEDVGRIRFPPPGGEALQGLTPAQRRLVLDYFERLNRRAPQEAPGSRPDGPDGPEGPDDGDGGGG